MHVVQISFFVDPLRRAPEQLLGAWHSLADIAIAARTSVTRVTVVQASMVEGICSREGVEFHFVAPVGAGAPLTRAPAFAALLGRLRADIYHVHGLGFAREVLGLRKLAPRTPIFLQDHADRPPRFWRRALWRRAVALAAGVSFCARAQADPFARARHLAPHIEVFEIPESTSRFTPGDRTEARAATGVHGEPALLWVGHLDDNKDPLTVLDGVALAARDVPRLQLWCCYGTAPLLERVRARLADDPMLRDRVHLLGRVPHERVQELMRAADLFVLGSHREGSSFSLIEALASGLTPLVTDIPSLRALTGDGQVGALWKCGDGQSLARAIRDIACRPAGELRSQARAHFEAELSSVAIGQRFAAAYTRLTGRDAVAVE
ncbi:MAG TPA: glycosyltransferase family 4 protein [Steroidobacteraceae bacterium]|nr:glycosyltransferase family 4 protein [Steroidobacteraceae bacterium]